MKSYSAAARDYETWCDRQMDEEMEAEYDCDCEDFIDSEETERRLENEKI